MRRKDREMSRKFALNVVDNSEYGVLGICKDVPYTIPLSLVRQGDFLYFHSAKDGKKINMIEDGDRVSVSFVSSTNIPKILSREEIENLLESGNYGQVGSKVYTTEFASAHINGIISKVYEREEIIEALELIANKYRPDISDLAEKFILNSLSRVAVYKIEIIDIKGKRKKFDRAGEEMKFQRMED